MGLLLTELLETVPEEPTLGLVERTQEQWKQPLRELLRRSMGLTLHRGGLDPAFRARNRRGTMSLPIQVLAGLPNRYPERALGDEHDLAARIAPLRDTLRTMEAGAGRLLVAPGAINSGHRRSPPGRDSRRHRPPR